MVDGDLVPGIRPRAYKNGKCIKDLYILTSNGQNEAQLLKNQSFSTNADFDNWVSVTFLYTSRQQHDHIISALYLPIYNGSHVYIHDYERNEPARKDFLISCNIYSIARAYNNQTHIYIFGFPPAIHPQDLAYTYYATGAIPEFFTALVVTLQSYITGLNLTGNLNSNPSLPYFRLSLNEAMPSNLQRKASSRLRPMPSVRDLNFGLPETTFQRWNELAT